MSKKRKTRLTRISIGMLILIVLLGVTATIAFAFTPPLHVSETLQACRFTTGLTLPIGGKYICLDGNYTTGNLAKGWNELDLVPHRLTTTTASNSSTAYDLIIAGDYQDGGKTGWDFISIPVVNTSKSDASCTINAGDIQYRTGGTGGTTSSIYREVHIQQNTGTTCVFDYYQRLALGAAQYSGSSLQSYMFESDDFKTGKKTLSIPVREALPQELSKDMSASQGTDHIWTVTKSPSPATLTFANTCGPVADLKQTVSLKVDWEIKPANPNGPVTITTHVYAKNPAARSVTVTVTDKIYKGPQPPVEPPLDTVISTPMEVPANTTQLVLTHTFVWTDPEAGVTQFNDVATGTYTDTVAGVPIPQTPPPATASATTAYTGPELNKTATINDTESITGAGLTFSTDTFTPAIGAMDGGYVLGTPTTGPVSWTALDQSANGSVTFGKTVYVAGPSIVAGSLTDTATLTGNDGFTTSANGTVDISTSALVSLTINKTIDVAQAADATFGFQVMEGSNIVNASVTVKAGDLSGSVVVPGLKPNTLYTVSEVTQNAWVSEGSKTVQINLPSCSGSVDFANVVKKDLKVEKTAATSFTRTFTWGIAKNVVGESLKNISGGVATFDYQVDVTHDAGTDSAWAVNGKITVTNPNDFAVSGVTVTDAINGDANANCSVTGGTNVTVPAKDKVELNYSCAYGTAPAAASQVNTATAAWASYGSPNASASGTADVKWADATISVIDGSVIVTDPQSPNPPLPATVLYTDPSPKSFNYSLSFPGVGGTCTDYTNTATFTTNTTATTGSASAEVTVCVGLDLTVSKDVTPTFTRKFTWGITKSVIGDALKNISGGMATFDYKVDVTHDAGTDSLWALSGTITVSNPNDWEAIVLNDVTDVAGATTCTVNKSGGMSVPANGTKTFPYTCSMPNGTAGDNVATATWDKDAAHTPTGTDNGSAGFAFNTPTTIIDGSVTVTDTLGGNLGTVSYTDPSPTALKYSKSFQGVPGECQSFDNTATFTTNTTATTGSASKTVTVCASVLNVIKLTKGAVDPNQSWTFVLKNASGNQIASDGTSGKADGLMDFGNYLLDPAKKYTFCETNAPAGWASIWYFDANGDGVFDPASETITPYNPDQASTPPQDLGNRCVDFGAGTSYAIPTGGVIRFQVDNRYPGGQPRTIGYWKNWSTCTGGNQVRVAARNGGPAAGWYLLDDLLPQTLGTLAINNCEAGVNILGKKTIVEGKNKANDAAYNMAAQLLAAQLNAGAGARTCPAVQQAIVDANALLTAIGFDGNGDFLGPKVKGDLLAQRAQALGLANTLDLYNNGQLCP